MNDKQFKCPECGSGMFGTSDCLSDKMTGHCHGNASEGVMACCTFTWDRATQDKDVFTKQAK